MNINDRRKVSDEMLEAVAQRMYERLRTGAANWPAANEIGSRHATRQRYLNAAHSVLLLADEYWQ